MPAVLRALKSRAAQVALCQQLDYRIRAESGKLEHDQYNLVVKLINAALQDESSLSTTMIASALLPLVTAFHRGLAHGVVQFSYTSVQEHAVWNSIAFWEEAFYMEVQKQIVELHVKERQKRRLAAAKKQAKARSQDFKEANNDVSLFYPDCEAFVQLRQLIVD